MRKTILVTFILTFYFSIIYSQEKVTWDFPIRYGTNEWEQLITYEEKLNAYNIPEEILYDIRTSELVQACLNYPELRLLMTRNSLQQGYDYLSSIFNGFIELEKRNDAAIELLKEYKKLDPRNIKNFETPVKKGEFAFSIKYIEIFLAQELVLSNIDKKTKKEIIKVCISNYEAIEKIPEEYSNFGLITPALVLGRILEVDDYKKFRSKKNEVINLKKFIDNTLLYDANTLDYILSLSRDYLKQLEE